MYQVHRQVAMISGPDTIIKYYKLRSLSSLIENSFGQVIDYTNEKHIL